MFNSLDYCFSIFAFLLFPYQQGGEHSQPHIAHIHILHIASNFCDIICLSCAWEFGRCFAGTSFNHLPRFDFGLSVFRECVVKESQKGGDC